MGDKGEGGVKNGGVIYGRAQRGSTQWLENGLFSLE